MSANRISRLRYGLPLAALSFVSDQLRESSFVRHSRLVFSGVAGLFRSGYLAYSPLTRTFAAICGDRLADCDVSEPDRILRICIVAHVVSVDGETEREYQAMNTETNTRSRRLGRWLSIAIVAGAVILGLIVLYQQNFHPRTEDAEVFANFIGIAPQVEGPLIRLNVRDNQFVKKGELLYEIDERPYQYALETAISEQGTLEGQISDERRRIAALVSAVSVSEANIHSAEADVVSSERAVNRQRAEWTYASDNLHRIEPLLAKQFVTVDQVDRARTSETAESEALRQAESQLQLAKAGLNSALAQHEQSQHAVTTLEPLVNQRGVKEAAVKNARYNLDNCRVYAPFDAGVTNLTISEGAYAHVGQQMFTLIDARTWWAIGNFREGQLKRISPGMRADVYVLSKSNIRFTGVVDSIAFGVTPDPDVIGRLQPGLPDVQRTLNWVHLASRYPVRVRVENPTPDLFRVGESAVVTIRGN
jgi:membrane fusion protein, multidrug efflux system